MNTKKKPVWPFSPACTHLICRFERIMLKNVIKFNCYKTTYEIFKFMNVIFHQHSTIKFDFKECVHIWKSHLWIIFFKQYSDISSSPLDDRDKNQFREVDIIICVCDCTIVHHIKHYCPLGEFFSCNVVMEILNWILYVNVYSVQYIRLNSMTATFQLNIVGTLSLL